METNRHGGAGLLVTPVQSLAAARRSPHRTAAAVRMLAIVAGQLEHAYAAEPLLQPVGDLFAEWINVRRPLPLLGLAINWLAQRAGDRALTATQLVRDRAQAFPTLVQQMHRAAFHTSYPSFAPLLR